MTCRNNHVGHGWSVLVVQILNRRLPAFDGAGAPNPLDVLAARFS